MSDNQDRLAQDFINWWNDHVDAEGDTETDLDKSRDAVAHRYADAVESGQIEPFGEGLVDVGRTLFDRFVLPARRSRSRTMPQRVARLVDALKGETLLGADDPLLRLAFPLGDGTDKAVGYWTQDDWQASTTSRYRHAADSTRAANRFDTEVSSPFVDALRTRGRRTTAELFR